MGWIGLKYIHTTRLMLSLVIFLQVCKKITNTKNTKKAKYKIAIFEWYMIHISQGPPHIPRGPSHIPRAKWNMGWTEWNMREIK